EIFLRLVLRTCCGAGLETGGPSRLGSRRSLAPDTVRAKDPSAAQQRSLVWLVKDWLCQSRILLRSFHPEPSRPSTCSCSAHIPDRVHCMRQRKTAREFALIRPLVADHRL